MEEFVKDILFDPTIGKIITFILLSIAIVVGSRFIKARTVRMIKDIDIRYKIRKLITFVSYISIFLLILLVFSDKLGGLSVALGVAGAGIAFALQEVIASVAGWFAISFSGFYKVGDRVQLGQNVGDVIDIGILRTTLMECRQWVNGDQYTGRLVKVANSFIFKDSVINYSADFSFLWDEIKLPIRYGSDIELTRELFTKAAKEITSVYIPLAKQQWESMKEKYRIEDASIDPMVFMVANDNWIEFSLRYVVDFRSRRITTDKLYAFLINEINKSNKKIILASATFELVSPSTLDVNVRK